MRFPEVAGSPVPPSLPNAKDSAILAGIWILPAGLVRLQASPEPSTGLG